MEGFLCLKMLSDHWFLLFVWSWFFESLLSTLSLSWALLLLDGFIMNDIMLLMVSRLSEEELPTAADWLLDVLLLGATAVGEVL